jgi:prolyl oligopeptidase
MRLLVLFTLCLAFGLGQPPRARVDPVVDILHGVSIPDPYRWLEDQNSVETRAWIDGQIKHTESTLANLPQRERIRKRLGELMKIDTMGAPAVRNGRYFFTKRRAGQDQGVLYLRQGIGGADTVLIDPSPMSPDHTTSVSLMDVSRDGKVLAYGLRQGGEDETTLALMDVEARKDLPEHYPRARYQGFSMKPDRSGFYYVKQLAEGPRLYYHALGSDPATDKLLFGSQLGPEQWVECNVSLDGRWLTLVVSTGSAADKVEVFVQDLAAGKPIMPVVTAIDARFDAEVAGDKLYLLTNWNAPHSRILEVDLNNPAREDWKEIVPERGSVLDSFGLVGGKLVAGWIENVQTHIEILTTDGKLVRELKLPTLGVASGPFGRWDSDEAFYTFASFGQPSTVYRYSMSTGQQSVWSQVKMPFDPASVEVKQVWYESKDKTKVPMFVAYRKGLKLDGSHPVLLTAYGGFNLSMLPTSSATALAWLDMGGVYALANLRGGGEFGEEWHKAGMLDKKQNVFDDFIAAAEYLIREGYTQKSKLGIVGGSNGGLLVGAALTQRPDLFQAVVCGAPLLDMVRYDQFKVAKFWVPEYGTAQDPKQFPFIYKYSPYHHVEKGTNYPAVMFVTGDADTRVDPLHARKMAALLQASTGFDRPVLLRYDTKAGHSGGLPIDRQIETSADELSFLAWQLGIK